MKKEVKLVLTHSEKYVNLSYEDIDTFKKEALAAIENEIQKMNYGDKLEVVITLSQ